MPDISAISFKEIRGFKTADDGSTGFITFVKEGGAEFSLAFTPEQAMAIVDLAAHAATQCKKKRGDDPNIHRTFDVTWFSLGRDKASAAFVLSMVFGVGGQMSFKFGEGMARQIHETLSAMFGKSTTPTPRPRPN